MKISRRPSGDTPVGYWVSGLSVSRSTAPLPSAACQNRFRTPARSDVKISRRLSGVHTWRTSTPGVGRETCERRAAKIPEPEVALLIVGEHRDARAIG